MGDIEDDAVLAADLPEEGVHVVDGHLLQQARALPRPHHGVPQDVHHPRVPAPVQELELVAALRHAPPAGLAERRRGRSRHNGVTGGGAVLLRRPLGVVVVEAVLGGVGAALHHGLEPDEEGEAVEEHGLEALVPAVEVPVAVPGDAAEDAEALGADPAHQEPLARRHGVDGQVLDADEDDDGVDRRQVGDEVGEYGGHAAGQVGVDEADSGHPHQAQAGAEAEDPRHGDPAVELELVARRRAVVPGVHDGEEGAGDDQRHPPALVHLEQHRREVGELHEQGEPGEQRHQDPVALPHQQHDRDHQQRRHQHHDHHRRPCNSRFQPWRRLVLQAHLLTSSLARSLTVGVADLALVLEPGGDGDAEDHEDPVDVGDVDLAHEFLRGVDDLHPREAAQRQRLLDDGEGGGDRRLARHHGGSGGDHDHGPVYAVCTGGEADPSELQLR